MTNQAVSAILAIVRKYRRGSPGIGGANFPSSSCISELL